MKKIFITLAFVFMLSCSAYADGEPAHIIFGNVVNITGGNDSLHIQADDYSPGYRTAASSITVLDSIWSLHPVMFGGIPSERNALMNSGEPVDIIARGYKLPVIRWGGDGVYSVRLLDSNGNSLMKDTLRTRQDSKIEISLTPEYRHYYLEFTETNANYDSENGYFPTVNDSSGNEIRYCYVLLRMKSSNAEPLEVPQREVTPPESERRESNSAADAIDDIYRRLRNRAVHDSVLHMEDSQNETQSPDAVIRPNESNESDVMTDTHDTLDEHENEEDTNLIPARRIRIKRSTEYESESESESD